MNRKWRTALMFGLGAVLTMSLALPASSATTATIGTGKVKFPLVATISVTFACPAGAFYNVNLNLTQVQVQDDQSTITVIGSQNPRSYCTGKSQKINVEVPSDFSSEPWQRGTLPLIYPSMRALMCVILWTRRR